VEKIKFSLFVSLKIFVLCRDYTNNAHMQDSKKQILSKESKNNTNVIGEKRF